MTSTAAYAREPTVHERADPRWQHPRLRIQPLLPSMRGTHWDTTTWPTIKAEMKKALAMRSKIQRAG